MNGCKEFVFLKKFCVFCHVPVFSLFYGEDGNIQCSFCGFLEARYQDDVSFLFTFFSKLRVDWKIVQVPTVCEVQLSWADLPTI